MRTELKGESRTRDPENAYFTAAAAALGRVAAVLAIPALFVTSASVLELHTSWSGAAGWFSWFVIAVGLEALIIRAVLKSAPAGPPASARLQAAVLLTGAALFVYGALHHIEFHPLVLEGESRAIEGGAKLVLDNLHTPLALLNAYNIGPGLLYAPFADAFHGSTAAVKHFAVGYFAIVLGAALWLAMRVRPGAVSLLWAAPLTAAILIASVRRYKWHPGIFVFVLGVYLLLWGFHSESRRRTKLLAGFGACALGLFMYHASVLILPLAALIVALEPKLYRCAAGRIAVLAFVTGAAFLALLLLSDGASAAHEWNFARRFVVTYFEESPTRLYLARTFFEVFSAHGLSVPLALLFFTGVGGAVTRFRSCWFARASLVLFGGAAAGLVLPRGFHSPDTNCVILIQFLMLLFYGAGEVTRAAAGLPRRTGAALAVLVLALTLHLEQRTYFGDWVLRNDFWLGDTNPALAMGLALREARAAKLRSPTLRIILPADDAPLELGAFKDSPKDTRIRDAVAWRREFAPVLTSALRYRTVQELEQLLDSGEAGPAVVYFFSPAGRIPPLLDELCRSRGERCRPIETSMLPEEFPVEVRLRGMEFDSRRNPG